MSLTSAKERATCAGDCRRVSESVQNYNVQYKGLPPSSGHILSSKYTLYSNGCFIFLVLVNSTHSTF
jgi:hypothetical protein